MGQRTLAGTIKEISRRHLEENNGLLLGQCVTAVGWVNGTVPNCKGIIELPMTETCGAGIAVGAAMVGRRPIFVIRFQDFMILNGSPFINYAAKSKELHGRATPLFIRAIASEGIGPVHSGMYHSVFMHFPGFRVCAPMTPGEYKRTWEIFMKNDDPMYASEHRESFNNTGEMEDVVHDKADITIYAISSPRLHVENAAEKLNAEDITCNIVHVFVLKPFEVTERLLAPLKSCGHGIVVDSSFEICGASRSIAYQLTQASGIPVRALALEDHTKCLCPPFQNKAPEAEDIYKVVRQLVKK